MIHDRRFKRIMRARSIRRKKRILKCHDVLSYLKFDGMYSKGKIHSSSWTKKYYRSYNEEKANKIMDLKQKEEINETV